MRRSYQPPALAEATDVLQLLSDAVAAAEDDLLASLVVLGEPDAQQTVDGWVDQLVDLLRAVDEVATRHRTTFARALARHPSMDVGADAGDSVHGDLDTLPTEHR